MPVALLNLCFFLLCLESVLSVCEVSVRTLNFGCHLEWKCPDAPPETTYTVQSKAYGSWEDVSECTRISRHNCDLSHVFSNIHAYNYMSLRAEALHNWTSDPILCDPVNDNAATFSPPSITFSLENGSIWVTVHFPCAPAITCSLGEEDDEEEDVEGHCRCPLLFHTEISASVMLYDRHKPLSTQTRSSRVLDEKPLREEFGFFIPGHVYCAVANFTVNVSASPVSASPVSASPVSAPHCIEIPAKTESLIAVVVCAVIISLGLVFILLWTQCASPEPSLPKSLALLHDDEFLNAAFLDSSRAVSDRKSSESDQISVVSLGDFTLVENHSYSPGLGNGYYRTPVLQDPDCIEECLDSGDLETDGTDSFDHHITFPSHVILEEGEQSPYLDECKETLNIPLSSVRMNCTGQEETTDDLEQYGDVTENTGEQESVL